MKIHKRNKSTYSVLVKSLCNKWIPYQYSSYQWKKVECGQCLKQMKGGKDDGKI